MCPLGLVLGCPESSVPWARGKRLLKLGSAGDTLGYKKKKKKPYLVRVSFEPLVVRALVRI